MIPKFDLNIDNYDNEELAQLLNLQYPYTSDNISSSKKNLQGKLLEDDSLGSDQRNSIVFFLDNICERLANSQPKNDVKNFMDLQNNIIEEGNNIIIKRPNEHEGLNASSSAGRILDSNGAPPGYLNPINVKTIKRTINIDSRFRSDYYRTKSTDFVVDLPSKVTKVISMSIATMEVPLSYYSVSRELGNSTFVIRDIVGGAAAGPFICHLPDGNYEISFADKSSAAHIEPAMNRAMQAAGVPAADLVFNVDPVGGKSIIANPAGGSVTSFTVDFNVDNDGNVDQTTNLQHRLGWQLGFRTATYIATGGADPAAIVSEGVCYIKGPRYAFITLDDYNNNTNNYFMSAFSSSILSPNIIARLNFSSSRQNDFVYHSMDADEFSTAVNRTRSYFGPVDIQKLKVGIIDEYGRILDLNNMDWSFTISLECLYD